MREACLYNNWSLVPIFLKIYRALMRWTPWSFLGRWRWWVATMGHSPRMRSGGSGDEGSLPNSFRWEFILFIKTHFYGGALISYIYISCFHDDVIKWKHVPRHWLVFVRGIHRRLRGIHRSSVNSPHTDQWSGALTFSLICAWTGNWVKIQDAGDLRRYRAHYDVTVMWCRIVIQGSGQPWDLSAFNASLLSNFELVKRVKLGGSVHNGKNGLKFGTLLYPDYHSLKLTIFCTQRQFKFVVSDHP